MKATEWTEAFASGKMDDKLSLLYGNAKATLEQQRQRYVDAIQAFTELYPEREDLYILKHAGHGTPEFFQPETKKIVVEFFDKYLKV